MDSKIIGNMFELNEMTEDHFDSLFQIAQNPKLWTLNPEYDGSHMDGFKLWFEKAIRKKIEGIQFPYVVVEKKSNQLVGATRFYDIGKEEGTIKIGFTWYKEECWGTACNAECKLLLIQQLIEQGITPKFRIDTANIRSCKAVEKIGAKLEKVIPKDVIRKDGTWRDSNIYYIPINEWPHLREKLLARIK